MTHLSLIHDSWLHQSNAPSTASKMRHSLARSHHINIRTMAPSSLAQGKAAHTPQVPGPKFCQCTERPTRSPSQVQVPAPHTLFFPFPQVGPPGCLVSDSGLEWAIPNIWISQTDKCHVRPAKGQLNKPFVSVGSLGEFFASSLRRTALSGYAPLGLCPSPPSHSPVKTDHQV